MSARRLTKRQHQKRQEKTPTETPRPASSERTSTSNPLEVPHLRKLEADLSQLAEAFNLNSKIFSHGLTVGEMRMRVVERAMNDMLGGSLRTVELGGVRQVDYQSYTTEFACCMLMAEFAEWLLRLQAARRERVQAKLGLAADGVLVFGGSA